MGIQTMTYLGNIKHRSGSKKKKIHAIRREFQPTMEGSGYQCYFTYCGLELSYKDWETSTIIRDDIKCVHCRKQMGLDVRDDDEENDGKNNILFITVRLNNKHHTTLLVEDEEEIMSELRKCFPSWADSLFKTALESGDICIYKGRKLNFDIITEIKIDEVRLFD